CSASPAAWRSAKSAPSSNTCRFLARDHAAPQPTLALAKAASLGRDRGRPLAWCSRPRNSAALLEGALVSWRERGFSYLIVGPFAIVLAFPFYWMLVTMFKTNGDLYNLDNVPFTYHRAPPALSEKLTFAHDHWLPLGFQHATASHVSFIFHDTNYVRWLQNTAIVGGLVVLITLLLAGPAAYSLAR